MLLLGLSCEQRFDFSGGDVVGLKLCEGTQGNAGGAIFLLCDQQAHCIVADFFQAVVRYKLVELGAGLIIENVRIGGVIAGGGDSGFNDQA